MAAGTGPGQRSRVVKRKPTQSRGFYILLAAIVIGGGVALATALSRPKAPAIREADITAAQAEGYFAGNPNAPVQVLEFADFECPACAQFSLVTEPDVRKLLVATGLIGYRYFDFPLPQHRNTIPASLAAACAADQGKFWEMHDALFFNQPEWSSQATSRPMRHFTEYARQIGLKVDAWTACVDEQRHLARIIGNRKEGERRGVQQTPTFVIGRRVIAGSLPYDQLKEYVDSAAKAATPAPPPRATAPAPKR
jgi:protein-disulfide isomerase